MVMMPTSMFSTLQNDPPSSLSFSSRPKSLPLTKRRNRRRVTGTNGAPTPGAEIRAKMKKKAKKEEAKPFQHAIKLLETIRKKIHPQFLPTRGAIDRRVIKIVGNSHEILRQPKNASTIQMLRRYVRDIRAAFRTQHQPFCPSQIATVFLAQFAPATAHNYMVNVQTHIHKHFKRNRKWQQMMQLAQTFMTLHPSKQAIPTTPTVVRNLIGDLSHPCQRAILQLYTTASRWSESRPPRTPGGHYNLNVWKPSYYPQYKTVRLFLRTHKAATKGQRPYSKWIKVSDRRHANLYLKPHNVDYFKLLDYIKKRYPQHSVHSLRRGAIQRLQFLRFAPKQIVLLSGHNKKTKYRTLNKTYAADKPFEKDAVLAAKMSSALSNEVLPQRFRSRH